MDIIWPKPIKIKLFSFKSAHFTSAETRSYLEALIMKIEETLLSDVVSLRYKEEIGKFKGISRIVIDKFKIYYKQTVSKIIIIGIKFPGEKVIRLWLIHNRLISNPKEIIKF
ncbi:hypothetical protein KFZ58_02855 [Virgibacillus sp. NKC19-16]|uniref:hypothetical protein n=1 Tax=Virgibacillus salidurans TaxID=2831673 RepID=UPI001F36A9E8|nr:hypothetical protein [Virgibacillus sp. NKC19-16]UJL46903.1 hypothetical protein KFZ58_02855 [Virgibacillus sp. NKC19-16]